MAGRNREPLCKSRAGWTPETNVPLSKFVVPFRKIDEPRREITFTISTAGRDRDGDIIDQAGWELAEYKQNPIVLWSHEAWSPPIARSESVAVENGKLISVARFATREEHALADTIFRLYVGKFLNATSVGFEPIEMDLIEGEHAGDFGFRFTRQKLLEYSAVSVPSNPEALVVARSSGIDVSPCNEWIERMLDERNGGGIEDLLNKTYIALNGKLHPVQQDAIAKMNAATLSKADDKAADDDDDDRPVMATGAGGEDSHSHSFRHGDFQTDAAEDGHMHAISYAEDGAATIEGADGHGHDAPASADKNGIPEDEGDIAVQTPVNDPLSPIHGQPDQQRADDSDAAKTITDWPHPGMSLPVSLLTSEYRPFPIAEAKVLREDWPEIWGVGFSDKDPCISEFQKGDHDDVTTRLREDWAARHVDDFDLPGVVRQAQMLVRGSRGIEHMRLILSHAKEHVMNERDKAKGLSPEAIDAITDRIVSKAVVPAIEKAFREHSGRLS